MTAGRIALWPAVAATALVLLSSCSSELAGAPVAAGSTTAVGRPTTSASTGPTTTTAASGPNLATIDPCELLTPNEMSQLDVPAGEPDTTAGNPVCRWNQVGDRAVVSVTLWLDDGLDDLNPGNANKIENVTVGSHSGRRLEDPDGYCSFDLVITEKSTVTVATLMTSRLAEACAFSERVVNAVEPKLPRA